MAWGVAAIAIPLIVLGRLHRGPALVGAVFAAQGLGGVIASTMAGRIDTRGRERSMIAYPMVASALVMGLLLPDAGWMGRAFAVSMSINALGFPIGSGLAGAVASSSVEAAIRIAIVASVIAGVAAHLLIPRD